MNKIFLSGVVADTPVLTEHDGGKKQLTFALIVSHRTKSGDVRYERYPINVWNKAAVWAHAHLHAGMNISLQGYLSQRILRSTGICVTTAEVTVEQLMPVLECSAVTTEEAIQAANHAVSDSAEVQP